MTLIDCETCVNGYMPSGHQCGECQGTKKVECEHGDICEDERVCLICDEDMTELLACAAEEWNDLRSNR